MFWHKSCIIVVGGATLKIHLGVMVLLAFLLVACGGSAAPVAYDPYTLAAIGENESRAAQELINVANNQMTATAQHMINEGEYTTFMQTQLAAKGQATGTAIANYEWEVSVQATQQAPAVAIQMAQMTVYAEATGAALTQTPAVATAAALSSATTKQQALSYVVPLGVTFLFLSGGAMIFLVGIDLGAWFIERDKMRQARYDSQFGFTTYDYDSGRWILQSPSDKYKRLPAINHYRPDVKVSPGGVTATSAPVTTVEPLVREFLEAAARNAENGINDNKIPSWRNLPGWTSERWQRAVDVLKVNRIVDPRDRVGTFVKDGTIGDVLYQLDTQQLHLTPLPRPRVPVER